MAHKPISTGWGLYSVVRMVYRQGPPLWDIEEWTKQRAAEFTQSVHARRPDAAEVFTKQTADAADVELKARWDADPGAYHLYLLPAVAVMAELVEDRVNSKELPAEWDRSETITRIKGGLHLVDTKLTPRQREAIHLESLIGVNRATAARAMNVSVKCAGSHLSTGWSELPKHRADVELLGWFVTSIGGNFPTRTLRNATKEVSQDVQRPVPTGAIEENKSV